MVPLPDVPEYTDDIIFGNLGLPSGFDQERLLVNIRGMQRVRAAALMGSISIVSERGEAQAAGGSVAWLAAPTRLSHSIRRRSKSESEISNIFTGKGLSIPMGTRTIFTEPSGMVCSKR